ncbi:uncharacterized protein LOC116415018 isoform X1 [Apis florea]|uniref:uncharacterized protein LOC116415018 isoform X1 n=1 Tax=Apis florea TaxID=7463 RepID=UPI0012FF2F2A|nr:uncharacterized protein LOC116415018 isoform X1 [Apis florea]
MTQIIEQFTEIKKEEIKEASKEEKIITEELETMKSCSLEKDTNVVTEITETEKLVNGKAIEIIDLDAIQSSTKEEKTKPTEKSKKEETKTKSGKQKQFKEKADIKAKSIPDKEPKKQDKQEISSPDSKKKREEKSKKTNDIPTPVSQEIVSEISPVEFKKEESQIEIKEALQEEIQPSLCTKSWASIVSMKGNTETINNSTDISKVTSEESIPETPKLEKIEKVDEIVPEEPQSPPAYQKRMKHQKKKDAKQEKNVIEKASSMNTENEREKEITIEESQELITKDSNKSYAQVAASNKRTSPQFNQEDIIIAKPIPIMLNQSIEKKEIAQEEALIITEIENIKEETIKSEEEVTMDKKFDELVIKKDVFKMESTSWVEEIEKEALEEEIDFKSSIQDIESPQKTKDSWAAIVGKYVEPSKISSPTVKKERTIEQHSYPQVQIHVEQAPEPVPIEEVVQVDEQGFIEFVNRKELRSRRSRSRSRSTRRDDAKQSSDKPIVPEEILAIEQKEENAEKIEEQKKKETSKGKEEKSKKDKRKAKSNNADRNQITKEEQEKEKNKTKVNEIEEETTEEPIEQDIEKTNQPKKKGKGKSKIKEVEKDLKEKSKEEIAVEKVEKNPEEKIEIKEGKEKLQAIELEVPETDKIMEVNTQDKIVEKSKIEIKEQFGGKKNKKSKKGKSDKEQPKQESKNKEQAKQTDNAQTTEIELKLKEEITKESEIKNQEETKENIISEIEYKEIQEKSNENTITESELLQETKSDKPIQSEKYKKKSKERKAEIETSKQVTEAFIEENKVFESEIQKEIPKEQSEAKDVQDIKATTSEFVQETMYEKPASGKRKGKSKDKKKAITTETAIKEKEVSKPEIKEILKKEPDVEEIKEIKEIEEELKTIMKSEDEYKSEITKKTKSEKLELSEKNKDKSKEEEVTKIEEKKLSELKIKEITAEIALDQITETSIEENKIVKEIEEKISEKELKIEEDKEVQKEIQTSIKCEIESKPEIVEQVVETKFEKSPKKRKGKSKEKKVETISEQITEISIDEKKLSEFETKKEISSIVKEVVKEEEVIKQKKDDTDHTKQDTVEKNKIETITITSEKLKEKENSGKESTESLQTIAREISDSKTETIEEKEEAKIEQTEDKSKVSKKEKRKQKKKEKSATRATSQEKLKNEKSEMISQEQKEEINMISKTSDELKAEEISTEIILTNENKEKKETNEISKEIEKLILSEVIPDEIKLVPETMPIPISKEEIKVIKEIAELPKPAEEKEIISDKIKLLPEAISIPVSEEIHSIKEKTELLKPKENVISDKMKLVPESLSISISKEEIQSIKEIIEPKPIEENEEIINKTKDIAEEKKEIIKSVIEKQEESKKSKRKNKQAKKTTYEEAEMEIKSADEDLLSSKIEKDIEILSTGSSTPTPDIPKEILQIEEKTLNVTIPEPKLEVNDILIIDEIKKDEKEIKNMTEEIVLEKEKKQIEEKIFSKTQEEIEFNLQKIEETPSPSPIKKKATKEEKSKIKKIKDKGYEDKSKNDDKEIHEIKSLITEEKTVDKISEIIEDTIIPLEEKPTETIKSTEVTINGTLKEEIDEIEKEIIKIEEIEEIYPEIVKENIIQEIDKVPEQFIPIEKLLDEIESPIIIDSIESQLETEEEFEKCISSEPEIETVDIVIEPAKPKVQFYIADEILVLSPEKKKPVQTPLILKTLSELSRSKFLSLDSGFWPDKHPYHEAERYLFENLANYPKENTSSDIKRDSNDPDDFNGDQNDGNLNNRGGNGGPMNSFFLGGPHTERLIADLPGGIGSWSDYSTYLSSENEQRTDQTTELVQEKIENPTLDLTLPSDEVVSELSSVHLEDDQSISKFDELSLESVPTTSENSEEIKLQSLSTVEVSPLGEQPSKLDHEFFTAVERLESTCSDPSCEIFPIPNIPDHGPDPKENLGIERGSMQRRTPITEREMGVAEDEAEKRIRGIKDIIQERLMVLQLSLSNLKGTYLPRDNIDTMLSALTNLITELQNYDQETHHLEEELHKIPADLEAQKLLSNLEEIQTKITTLLTQAEQGRATLEGARGQQEQRGHDIHAYKKFLDETDSWLKDIVASMKQEPPIATNKALQDELSSHAQRVSELESLPEISTLAKVLKNALLEVMSRLQQRQQEIRDEEARADETSDRDDATLDQAPSIHSSLESNMPSLADVSLQTGQSLLANEIVEKPQQLTKQTSTNQIPIATECHSLTTQTVDTVHPAMESMQTQETIKILKTTEGDHDVIEIATKNVPTSAQEIVQDRPEQITEDIVVDMKYQDPTNTDNTTSELNIVHAAPQSFETVLVEPDDVTTEVVVDEDGSKRIIVRKLRRTTMTSRQTTQQHLSSTSTAIGDAPSVVQAFSEATMKDQQVTITTTKPDGTIETVTKQIHGGRVATGTPFKDVNVDEYESSPQYTHMVTQGHIRDISPQPFEEGILMEGGEYRAKTSSVHAVVQQVTRRVVRKTRRIIRKVTIIDGKETATEEIIEEPEEVEIDEKNIPHISINVIKQEEQRNLGKDEGIEEKDRIVVEDITEKEDEEDRDSKVEKIVDDIPMQGPFFGAFAKDMHPSTTYLVTEREEPLPDKKDTLTTEKKEEKIDINVRSEKALENPLEFSVADIQESLHGLEESLLQSERSDKSLKIIEKKVAPADKYEHEHFLVEVNGKKFLQSTSQAFIDAEVSATLQSPSQEIKIQESQVQKELAKSSIESIVSEDLASVTKETCKFVDAPVSRETLRIEVEDRTVDVEKHHDTRGTVDVPVLEEKSSIEKWMKEKSESLTKLASTEVQKRVHVSEERPVQIEEIVPSTSTPTERKRHVELEALPIDVKQQIVKNSFVPEIDYSIDDYMDEALKPEYKPIFHKVEISLAVKREGEEMQPTVSVRSQSEPEAAPYRLVKEDVDIRLPADKESISVIHDKIVQTSPPMIESKVIGLDKSVGGSEKEIVTSDKSIITSEREETDKSILTSEKEIVMSEKEETDKSIITSEKEEISDHVITSEKEDECLTESTVEPEAEAIIQLDKKIEKQIESPMLSMETKSSVSLVSNIGDSMEIDVPLSDSSKHVSEAPQPDIAKMFESREVELYLKEETSEGEDGYEADRTIVTTTPDDETVTKTKRRKKKKQRVRSSKDEEQTEFPKTTTDDGEFTDDETLAESEDAKATKKKKKKKKREEIDFGKEKIVPIMIMADTQTVPREFSVSIATSPKQETVSEIYVQTSPHLLEDVKLKIEEIHEQVQTSPPISLEELEKSETPKVKEVHAEMQTSPLSASDFGMQTVSEEKSEPEKPIIQHSEMQTSPLPASDFSGQTVEEEVPKIEEISTQTMESPVKEMEEYAVQTSPIEDIKPEVVPIETEEIHVQTVATEVVSIEAQTSPTAPSMEIETQTAEKVVVAVEQQTTPPPTEEKILTGIAVQTVTPETPKTIETEAQTSKPTTPEITTLDFNVQADLIEQPIVDVMETQTTPEESPRQAETHETESQTIQPEPTQEIMIQTCPVTFAPEKVEVCELSSQTSLEEIKRSIDEQSQTITPEKIETLDSSIQIKTSELIEQIEESVQIVPETREKSEQTSIEEKKPLLVTSSQQTNGVQIADSEKEFVVEDEKGNLVEAMIDEVDASMEIKAPLILTEIPVAPDVQVQETKEYVDTKTEEVTEPVSVIEEPLKIEELRMRALRVSLM